MANSCDKICGGMRGIRSWELWIQSQPVDYLNQQWSVYINVNGSKRILMCLFRVPCLN